MTDMEIGHAAQSLRSLGLRMVRVSLRHCIGVEEKALARAEGAYSTEPMRSAAPYLAALHRDLLSVYRRYATALPEKAE